MSKELKPYEKENEIIRKLRECKNSRQYMISQLQATERGFERNKRTYEHAFKVYTEEIEKAKETIESIEKKIIEYSNQLKEFLPKLKPKPRPIEVKNQAYKIKCDTCGKFFAKTGIKSHSRACLKKLELAKIQEEIEKLELEETLEELEKEDKAEINLDELEKELVKNIGFDIVDNLPDEDD